MNTVGSFILINVYDIVSVTEIFSDEDTFCIISFSNDSSVTIPYNLDYFIKTIKNCCFDSGIGEGSKSC